MTTLSRNYSDCIDSGSRGILAGLNQRIQHWFEITALKKEVSRERQQLLEMSDTMLADIGINQAQANEEAQRGDLPAERLKLLSQQRC